MAMQKAPVAIGSKELAQMITSKMLGPYPLRWMTIANPNLPIPVVVVSHFALQEASSV